VSSSDPAGPLTEEQALELMDSCSNAGRWGVDDELGTLNLITAEKRIQAARLVTSGMAVSLGRDLNYEPTVTNTDPPLYRMQFLSFSDPLGLIDSVLLTTHGLDPTHLDALGHVNFEGAMYNGRRVAEIASPAGLSFASIHAMRDGIVTRGVLLDVAHARGVDWLEPGDEVTPGDLERAEELAGARVEPGDALFVRVGTFERDAALGQGEPMPRTGLDTDSVAWLHARDVAVFSGDCSEKMPSPYPRLPLPLHQIGLVAMGLVLLDNTDVAEIARIGAESGRYTFMLVCAPLRLPGATGSHVNPLALY
jgi:kynurenine formamidase